MAGTKQIDTLFNKVLHQRDYLKCPYDYGDFNDDPGDPDYGKPPDYDVEFYPTSDYDTSYDEVYNENYYKDQIGKEIYEYTKKLIHKLSDKIDSIERKEELAIKKEERRIKEILNAPIKARVFSSVDDSDYIDYTDHTDYINETIYM